MGPSVVEPHEPSLRLALRSVYRIANASSKNGVQTLANGVFCKAYRRAEFLREPLE